MIQKNGDHLSQGGCWNPIRDHCHVSPESSGLDPVVDHRDIKNVDDVDVQRHKMTVVGNGPVERFSDGPHNLDLERI